MPYTMIDLSQILNDLDREKKPFARNIRCLFSRSGENNEVSRRKSAHKRERKKERERKELHQPRIFAFFCSDFILFFFYVFVFFSCLHLVLGKALSLSFEQSHVQRSRKREV